MKIKLLVVFVATFVAMVLFNSNTATAAVIGVWEDAGSVTYLDDEITAAGHTVETLSDLSASSLAGIQALYLLNEDNFGYDAAISSQASAIDNFVFNGGELHFWDRATGNAEDTNDQLPGTQSISFVRQTDPDDLEIVADAHPYFTGLDDTSFDGGSSSAHGYATLSSLPAGYTSLLTFQGESSEVVDFLYTYGSGRAHYSSIPADYYLTSTGTLADSLSTEVYNISTTIPEPASVAMLGLISGLGFFIRHWFLA